MMPIDVNLDEMKTIENFGDGCPGCGIMLGMKLLLQTLDNAVIVNATGSFTSYGKNLNVPFIHAGLNASAVARGIARSSDETVVVFAGDGATSVNLNSLLNSKEDIIYVCANDWSYSSINYKLEKSFAKHVAHSASYSATASVSYPSDYIAKLRKAAGKKGFKFIDLLCPCPASWGYETSNTIEIGRVAVETGLWPVYEVEKGRVTLTKRPNRLEPVENFNHFQKKFRIGEEEKEAMQNRINRNWKVLTDGRIL